MPDNTPIPEGTDYITIRAAAALTGHPQRSISSLLDRGHVRYITNPHAANPRRSHRLVDRDHLLQWYARAEVEAEIRAQNRKRTIVADTARVRPSAAETPQKEA